MSKEDQVPQEDESKQKTRKGKEIPLPKREQVMADFRKIVQGKPAASADADPSASQAFPTSPPMRLEMQSTPTSPKQETRAEQVARIDREMDRLIPVLAREAALKYPHLAPKPREPQDDS